MRRIKANKTEAMLQENANSCSTIIRDPFVLELTGLPQKKRYKESELETALKANMEHFLLELGRGFAFIGRQY